MVWGRGGFLLKLIREFLFVWDIIKLYLTPLPLRGIVVISWSVISEHISWNGIYSWALVRLFSGECHRTPLMISQHWLIHWGWVTHICVSSVTTSSSDNGLSPSWHQTIIWTSARLLLIRPLETNFSEILSKIHASSFKKMHLKMSSGKWRPFCLGLNELIATWFYCSDMFSLHINTFNSLLPWPDSMAYILQSPLSCMSLFSSASCLCLVTMAICSCWSLDWNQGHWDILSTGNPSN